MHQPVDGGGSECFRHELVEANWNWLRFLITHLGFDLRTYVVGVSG